MNKNFGVSIASRNKPGDRVQITGKFSKKDAEKLISRLRMEGILRSTYSKNSDSEGNNYFLIRSIRDMSLNESTQLYKKVKNEIEKIYPSSLRPATQRTLEFLGEIEPGQAKPAIIKSFDEMTGIKRGKSQPNRPKFDRILITDAPERAIERENAALAILERDYPNPKFRVENHTQGAQVGGDFLVYQGTKLIAVVDAKSNNQLTKSQWDAATKNYFKRGIPYFLLIPERQKRILITPNMRKEVVGYKVWER